MSGSSSTVLKEGNFKWLVMTAAADLLLFLLILAPSIASTWAEPASIVRLIIAAVVPVAVLIIVDLVPQNVKASLVFWKGRHALPGHEAFSKHAAADTRIDLGDLRRAVGQFPTDPAAQNTTWYRLYKQVDAEPSVTDAHRRFLLFRDVAAMSALLLVVAPGLLLTSGMKEPAAIAAAIMLCQYAASAIGARHAGVRFVQNVLATHAARAVAPPSPIIRL